jgi:radical SAM protein with 4Fe4S-binding SPASM domain
LSGHSSVTIVTNGKIRLEGISPKLACFGIPIHGSTAETHERFTRSPGGFVNVLSTIEYYVGQGFDVRCIPVLTGFNFDQMFDIIRLASDLGMESVFVDRFEDGGIGAQNVTNFRELMPTPEQFRIAVGQIIEARHVFSNLRGKVGFGTAIPYCLDDRIIEDGIQSDCGVGTTFCAISPKGEFRICNQSEVVYGYVPEERVEVIWRKKSLNGFRCLAWVTEPCKSCPLLTECVCGCKVDVNASKEYCIDYAARGGMGPSQKILETLRYPEPVVDFPKRMRSFRVDRFAKVTTRYTQPLLVTRYQTVEIDGLALEMMKDLMIGEIYSEPDLIALYKGRVNKPDVRRFVSQLIQVDALDLTGEV